MNWFKRKVKSEPTPLCFHEWKVADVGVGYSYNGIVDDAYDYFVLGCEKCGDRRKVNEYEFDRMKRLVAMK
jgi:hypothetical protein